MYIKKLDLSIDIKREKKKKTKYVIVCVQHGPDECMLNTVEACTISIYPNTVKFFYFF